MVAKVFTTLRDALASLLKIEAINRLMFRIRFLYFVQVRHRIRVSEDQGNVIKPEYSIAMLKRGITSDRPLCLIRPLSVIAKVEKASAKVLAVGCRFETELLYLLGYGFRDVRGLDLISYSPWIDVGNMHEMPYRDGAWDVVLLGWVLSYSESPERAVQEVIRVAKNGAVIAVAVSYYPAWQLDEAERRGTMIGKKERIQTVDAILRLFDGNVERVYFSHDAPARDREGYAATIFSISK